MTTLRIAMLVVFVVCLLGAVAIGTQLWERRRREQDAARRTRRLIERLRLPPDAETEP